MFSGKLATTSIWWLDVKASLGVLSEQWCLWRPCQIFLAIEWRIGIRSSLFVYVGLSTDFGGVRSCFSLEVIASNRSTSFLTKSVWQQSPSPHARLRNKSRRQDQTPSWSDKIPMQGHKIGSCLDQTICRIRQKTSGILSFSLVLFRQRPKTLPLKICKFGVRFF